MNDRIPLDHLTSDQYDALCDRIDELDRGAAIDQEVWENADRECDEHIAAGRAFKAWANAWQARATRAEARERELHQRLTDAEHGITAAIRQRKAAEDRALRAEAQRDRHAAALTTVQSTTERQFLRFALDLAADYMASHGDEFGDEDIAALEKLRLLAADELVQPHAKPTRGLDQ